MIVDQTSPELAKLPCPSKYPRTKRNCGNAENSSNARIPSRIPQVRLGPQLSKLREQEKERTRRRAEEERKRNRDTQLPMSRAEELIARPRPRERARNARGAFLGRVGWLPSVFSPDCLRARNLASVKRVTMIGFSRRGSGVRKEVENINRCPWNRGSPLSPVVLSHCDRWKRSRSKGAACRAFLLPPFSTFFPLPSTLSFVSYGRAAESFRVANAAAPWTL